MPSPLRVMTYNIQYGCGRDRRIDLERTVAVIASFAPDVLLLQEVDVAQPRSGHVDQVAYLAAKLDMAAAFAPTVETVGARHGNATLSRVPVRDQRRIALPYRDRPRSIPRCALVTRLDWPDGGVLEIVNTHLSVVRGDRPAQAALIASALGPGPVVLGGDLNCTPWSPPFHTLARGLRSVTRFARSWPAWLPFAPVDHLLVRGAFEVRTGGAWCGGPARMASDHLPVVAELVPVG